MSGSPEITPVVLVSVQLPGVSDTEHEASLAELGRLAHTLGHRVVATVSQKRTRLAQSAVIGEGKLVELAAWTGGEGVVLSAAKPVKNKARARWASELEDAPQADADDELATDEGDEIEADAAEPSDDDPDALFSVPEEKRAKIVIVDHEISPSQARNLERATGVEVLDRTGVIVEIFHRHARSREAKLQVEIARLAYVAPRMRETGGADRQRGGIGGKGAGESSIELDRRKIRDRIAELRTELKAVQRDNDGRRYARRDQLRVALVGYTNAGKSSLMRALTGSDVLVADKLFATLDTTVRHLHPETRPRILVSDTVGFIDKLPHDLVASFKSTLDEALEASLLLYVVDASDPTHEKQLEVTRSVLHEIGADVVPSLLILNKVDRLDATAIAALRLAHPDALLLSAREAASVASLRTHLIEYFDRNLLEELELVVPYTQRALVGEIHEGSRVLSETYDELGAHIRLRTLPAIAARLRSKL